jgi:AcrR family transcriptional regulator
MALSAERRDERRNHLVQIAKALIREGGDAGFSMTQLASRAGVSPATPYNLVGGKADVLQLIVREDSEAFIAKLSAVRDGSPLAVLLSATALVVSHYGADPPFYRGIYSAAASFEATDLQYFMRREGRPLWQGLVRAAVDSAELSATLRVGPFTDALLRVIASTSTAWFTSGWSIGRFALEMSYAVRLPIAAMAAPHTRETLLREIASVQSSLAAASEADAPSAAPTVGRRAKSA